MSVCVVNYGGCRGSMHECAIQQYSLIRDSAEGRRLQCMQVPLASLGNATPATGGGGGGAGSASSKLFTDADLPSLKMCHK